LHQANPLPVFHEPTPRSGREATIYGDICYSHSNVYPPGTFLQTLEPWTVNIPHTHTIVEQIYTRIDIDNPSASSSKAGVPPQGISTGHMIPVQHNCLSPISLDSVVPQPGFEFRYSSYGDIFGKLMNISRLSVPQCLSKGLRIVSKMPCLLWTEPHKLLGEFFVVSSTPPGFSHACVVHSHDMKVVKWKKSGSAQFRLMEPIMTESAGQSGDSPAGGSTDAGALPSPSAASGALQKRSTEGGIRSCSPSSTYLMTQFAVGKCSVSDRKTYSARVSCVVMNSTVMGIFAVQVRDAHDDEPKPTGGLRGYDWGNDVPKVHNGRGGGGGVLSLSNILNEPNLHGDLFTRYNLHLDEQQHAQNLTQDFQSPSVEHSPPPPPPPQQQQQQHQQQQQQQQQHDEEQQLQDRPDDGSAEI